MKPADPRILTINGGSSSIKFALYQMGEPLKREPSWNGRSHRHERDNSDVRRPG